MSDLLFGPDGFPIVTRQPYATGGTFANTPPRNPFRSPLDDLEWLSDKLEGAWRHPYLVSEIQSFQSLSMLGITIDDPPSLEVVAVEHLGKYPPRLERVEFQGGRNLSAAERNRKRMEDANVCYVIKDHPGRVYCAAWLAPTLKKKLAEGGVRVIDA